jgi:hypothetical protein
MPERRTSGACRQYRFKTDQGGADESVMSESAHNTVSAATPTQSSTRTMPAAPAPSLPPPSGDVVEGMPAPRPNPLPLIDTDVPQLADTAHVRPALVTDDHDTPVIARPLTSDAGPLLPTLPAANPPATSAPQTASPALPTASSVFTDHPIPSTPATAADEAAPPAPATEDADGSEHPMADLMATTAAAREASKRAAEARAEITAKTRRTKIIIVSVALAIGVVVGPFVGMWVIDAVNDAGSTSTDEP